MPRIRVLTAVAGDPSWSAGEVVEVDDATATLWADGERAELVDEPVLSQPPRKKGPRGERAVAPPPGEVR
jgi:hypothetical protein